MCSLNLGAIRVINELIYTRSSQSDPGPHTGIQVPLASIQELLPSSNLLLVAPATLSTSYFLVLMVDFLGGGGASGGLGSGGGGLGARPLFARLGSPLCDRLAGLVVDPGRV